MKPNCPALTSFMQSFNLFNLIKLIHTSFKRKGSCVDLIVTNRKYCFKHSSTFEIGLIDHHHLVYSMLKICFKREESKLFIYRDYKNFYDTDFRMAFCKSTSHIPANIAHPKHRTSRTSHIPNTPHPAHPISRTSHIPNIPHPEHLTSPTSHMSNIPHPQHPTSPPSHIPYIPHSTFSTCHFPSISHSEHVTSCQTDQIT